MSGLTVAIDVGGTKLVGALLDASRLRHRVERPTPGPPGGADPGSQALRTLAAELADRAVQIGAAERSDPVEAVGLGCCEYVDAGRLTSTEVLAWTEQPADWLPAVFPGATVVVESDVRCGLLAEHRLGAARDLDSAVFVSWGTGLSSAVLVDGRIWPGTRGRAIALGELPGPLGLNLEGFVSGAGMAARGGRRPGVRVEMPVPCWQRPRATNPPPGPSRPLPARRSPRAWRRWCTCSTRPGSCWVEVSAAPTPSPGVP